MLLLLTEVMLAAIIIRLLGALEKKLLRRTLSLQFGLQSVLQRCLASLIALLSQTIRCGASLLLVLLLFVRKHRLIDHSESGHAAFVVDHVRDGPTLVRYVVLSGSRLGLRVEHAEFFALEISDFLDMWHLRLASLLQVL